MISFAEPSGDALAIHAAVRSAMEAARTGLKAGARPGEVKSAMFAAAADHGTRVAYWLGHGIGHDVIEEPLLGFDVVRELESSADEPELEPSMIFAVHPLLIPDDAGIGGYMADTYVVEGDGARGLSQHPLDLIRLPA